jgi:hypothetical protein
MDQEIALEDRVWDRGSSLTAMTASLADIHSVFEIFIEHFPSGGFGTTSYPPPGLSSPNITSTQPLNPVCLANRVIIITFTREGPVGFHQPRLTGFLVFYKCPSVS